MRATWISLVGIVGIGLTQSWTNAGDSVKLTAKSITGEYRIVDGEKDGKKIPKDEIDGAMVKFLANKIVTHDKDKMETYSATYKLDGKKITMTSIKPYKGITTHGLVKMEGGKLHLVYSLPNEKTKKVGPAPTDFKTGNDQLHVVMERVEK